MARKQTAFGVAVAIKGIKTMTHRIGQQAAGIDLRIWSSREQGEMRNEYGE